MPNVPYRDRFLENAAIFKNCGAFFFYYLTLCNPNIVRSKQNFLKNSSQNFGKIALLGVVGNERKIRGFRKLLNKQNARHFRKRKDGKGMEGKWGQETENCTHKQGNPANETGSERLYDKMKRLIKSETVKTHTDKRESIRYNKNSNLSVGRSLQEE